MSERNDRVGITEELADRVSSQTEFLVRIHEEFQDIFRGIAIELEEVRRALGLFSSGVARGTMSELRELSPREWEVLRELINGHRISGIATALCISPHTVRNHAKSIYRKLGVRSQLDLVARFRSPHPWTERENSR